MDEDQREIVSVVWKELGNRIVITYAEGVPRPHPRRHGPVGEGP